MFTFVISLVVVGAALFFATRIAIGAAPKPDKPATPATRSAGGRQRSTDRGRSSIVSPSIEANELERAAERADRISPWRRARSGLLLVLMLTVLGAVAALLILIFGAIILNGLRSAVQ